MEARSSSSAANSETVLKTRVNFLIGGAMKAGTSSVGDLLNQMEGIYCFDEGYELHFFGKDKFYRKGIDWYHSHFTDHGEALIGEKSISYLSSPDAAERIRQYNPAMKLVFILRNPVDRAYSHYQYCVQMGTEFLPFAQALRAEGLRQKLGGFFATNYSYQQRVLYYEQLMRYYSLFPEEQIHVMIFEKFKDRPNESMSALCDFLGVPFGGVKLQSKTLNATRVPRVVLAPFPFTMYRKYARRILKAPWLDKMVKSLEDKMYREGRYPPMDVKVRKRLLDYFAESNAGVAELLGRDLGIWDK